jgi:uncharacterized protein YjbI with pentapeptide repeats
LRVDHRTLVDKVWDDKAMTVLRTVDSGEEAAKALAGIEGVVLRRRSLRFAVLDESRLYDADLTGASLRSTDLSGAKLNGAKLSGANLTRANLTLANLNRADLRGVRYDHRTIFPPNFDPKAAQMVLIAVMR